MKNKRIIYIIIVILLVFVIYKVCMLFKYNCNKQEIDTNMIFNETLTINNKLEYGSFIDVDNISIPNYFEDYVDSKTDFKVKYDENNKVSSFYLIKSFNQYISILNIKNMEIAEGNGYDERYEYDTTEENMIKYLNNHNIKSDADLLKYIKENYYFNSNIFTCIKDMRNNYLLNSFVEATLPSYKNIILINGNIDGYIMNVSNESKVIKEIHILKGNKQYIILLGGNEITSDEFIIKLLSSIHFK